MSRDFRTPESYVAEQITRNMIEGFLKGRGYREVVDSRRAYGKNQAQTITAIDPAGNGLTMSVRTCWRPRSIKAEETFAAAQLLAKVENKDWIGDLTRKIERESGEGKTHMLIVERVGNAIRHAALIPLSSVVPIWIAQRDVSQRLIEAGKLKNKTANHAMNGDSPTLYLRENNAPEVVDALWNTPGVRDLAALPVVVLAASSHGDSVDDLPRIPQGSLGRDLATRIAQITSGVPRNERVRAEVIQRSRGRCERSTCGASRDFQGFLDVHHILGAENSDRVWTCVALCPNCHREAHFAPDRETLNAALLEFAEQFRTAATVY